MALLYVVIALIVVIPIIGLSLILIFLQLILKAFTPIDQEPRDCQVQVFTDRNKDRNADHDHPREYGDSYGEQNKEVLECNTNTNKTISIMTYNIAGLSPHINVNPPNRRLKEYCDRLSETPPELLPTVICFQESFHPYVSRNIIKNSLSSIYPYMVLQPLPPRPAVPGFSRYLEMDSGLAILSRLPITWARAQPFGVAVGADKQANKGVVAVGVRVRGGAGNKEEEEEDEQELCLVTTHLQSDPTNDPLWWFVRDKFNAARSVKVKQINAMRSFIASTLEGKDKVVGTVLCGDLNVKGEELEVLGRAGDTMVKAGKCEEYEGMMESFNRGREGDDRFVDSYRFVKPLTYGEAYDVLHVGVTIDGERNIDNGGDDDFQRLDFILTSGMVECLDAKVLYNMWEDLRRDDYVTYGEEETEGENVRRVLKAEKCFVSKKRPERSGKCFSDHSGVIGIYKIGGKA